jgi:hypothetical protein
MQQHTKPRPGIPRASAASGAHHRAFGVRAARDAEKHGKSGGSSLAAAAPAGAPVRLADEVAFSPGAIVVRPSS